MHGISRISSNIGLNEIKTKNCQKLKNLTNQLTSVFVNDRVSQDNESNHSCPNINSNNNNNNTNKRKHESHVLREILDTDITDDQLLPCIVKFNETIEENDSASKKLKNQQMQSVNILNKLIDFRMEFEPPSDQFVDYFEILPERTRSLETQGSGNSLFLSMARALLYKVNLVDKKYQFMLRKMYLLCNKNDSDFDSDMQFQQILRKNLCMYWLSFVVDGEFKIGSKYSRDFNNVCDFIYQVYQLSVNNFAQNRLFDKYALEDLAEMFKIKILVFEQVSSAESCQNNRRQLKIYEPVNLFNLNLQDFVYLSLDHSAQIPFKWLMPKGKQNFIDKALLSSTSQHFLQMDPYYAQRSIILQSSYIFSCFSRDLIAGNLGIALFLRFLTESNVQTLVSLNELSFDPILKAKNLEQMIKYLNRLLVHDHMDKANSRQEIPLDRIHSVLSLSSSSSDLTTSFGSTQSLNLISQSSKLKRLPPQAQASNHQLEGHGLRRFTSDTAIEIETIQNQKNLSRLPPKPPKVTRRRSMASSTLANDFNHHHNTHKLAELCLKSSQNNQKASDEPLDLVNYSVKSLNMTAAVNEHSTQTKCFRFSNNTPSEPKVRTAHQSPTTLNTKKSLSFCLDSLLALKYKDKNSKISNNPENLDLEDSVYLAKES